MECRLRGIRSRDRHGCDYATYRRCPHVEIRRIAAVGSAGMDALAGLLDGVRARGAFVLRLSLDPPWSMRIQDDALTLICQTSGNSVIITDSGDEFPLAAGDIALASGACHYLFTC